jgi:HEAT repeat protein
VVQVLRKLGPLGRDHLAALGPLLRDKEFADGQHFALESLDGATLLAAPGVLKALTEGEAPVRRRAARVLGVLGRDVRKEALKPLVDALRCASRRVWCW